MFCVCICVLLELNIRVIPTYIWMYGSGEKSRKEIIVFDSTIRETGDSFIIPVAYPIVFEYHQRRSMYLVSPDKFERWHYYLLKLKTSVYIDCLVTCLSNINVHCIFIFHWIV